jgi:hypothetical protein
MAVEVKTCNKCKRELPFDAFGRERRNKDGLRATCKECRSKLEKEYYERTKDKHAARVKKYKDANREEIRRKGRNPDEQRRCFHYSNLQPLWAEENWRKCAKVIHGS